MYTFTRAFGTSFDRDFHNFALNIRADKVPSTFFFGFHLRQHPSHYKTVLRGNAQPGDMHFFRVLPVLSLFLGASASSLNSRQPVPHRLDVRISAEKCATVSFYYDDVGDIGEI